MYKFDELSSNKLTDYDVKKSKFTKDANICSELHAD